MMTKRSGYIGAVAVAALVVCWAGTALAQPFPGGLPACRKQLEACQAGAQAFPATGQTTPFLAQKDDGIVQPVAVDDDGTLKLGTPLRYRDNGDGTVTDLNTRLMWEKKVGGSGCLRCVNDESYRWSIGIEDGAQKSIWDWLDDLNASNFAGHSDWRIPNVRELHSIVHYGLSSPSLDPVFGPSAVSYWSSTTRGGVSGFNDAAYVDFEAGEVRFEFKLSGNAVRAVR